MPCGGRDSSVHIQSGPHRAKTTKQEGAEPQKSAISSRYPNDADFLIQRSRPETDGLQTATETAPHRPCFSAGHGMGAEKNAISSRFFHRNSPVCTGNARKARFHPDPCGYSQRRPRRTADKSATSSRHEYFHHKNHMLFYLII